MSVLVVAKVPGDTAVFESYMASNKERVLELTERAKAGGCIAHRFAVGDGHVIIVDEWETPEQFQAFFSSPDVSPRWERWARGVNQKSRSRIQRVFLGTSDWAAPSVADSGERLCEGSPRTPDQ